MQLTRKMFEVDATGFAPVTKPEDNRVVLCSECFKDLSEDDLEIKEIHDSRTCAQCGYAPQPAVSDAA